LRNALSGLDAARAEVEELKVKLHRVEGDVAAAERSLTEANRTVEGLTGQLDGLRRERDAAQKEARDLSAEAERVRASLREVTAARNEEDHGRVSAEEAVSACDAEIRSLREAAAPLLRLLWPTPETQPPTLLDALTRSKERVELFAGTANFLGCRRSLAIAKSWAPTLDLGPLARGFASRTSGEVQRRLASEAGVAARAIAGSIKMSAVQHSADRIEASPSSRRRERSAPRAPEPDAAEPAPGTESEDPSAQHQAP
jgi:hypothetical protein